MKRAWDFHRIYHTYRERAKRTLRCSIGANLRESDLDNHNFTCLDCLQGANDRDVRRTHFNPTSSRKEDDFPPGTAVSMDVADPAQQSSLGNRYALIFVDIASKKPIVYFLKRKDAIHFKQAVEWLMRYCKEMANAHLQYILGECNGNTRLVGSQGSTETYPSTTRTCITRLGYFPS